MPSVVPKWGYSYYCKSSSSSPLRVEWSTSSRTWAESPMTSQDGLHFAVLCWGVVLWGLKVTFESNFVTVLVLRMAHRKWKESKQQTSMLPGPAVPGCCLLSFHILWVILCPQDLSLCWGYKKFLYGPETARKKAGFTQPLRKKYAPGGAESRIWTE